MRRFHCGFFFKCWDQMFGTVWKKENTCAAWARANGKRTPEQWKQIEASLPDYSVLLSPGYWLHGKTVGEYSKND